MRAPLAAFLAFVAGSAVHAAEPPSWYVLPQVTAFNLAQVAATRANLTAQIETATATQGYSSAYHAAEWWTVNRPLAQMLMKIPVNQVQTFPIYCERDFGGPTMKEQCYGPFPAKPL